MTEGKLEFHDFLAVDNIVCHPAVNDGGMLLNLLLELLHRHFPEFDRDTAAREVMAREEIFPTVIAPGLAVPHARLTGLEQPLVALGCVPEGVAFGSGGDQVKIMILLLTPQEDPNSHMQLLAALAEDFSKPDAIDTVAALATPAEVFAYFSGNSVVIPSYLKAADLMRPPVAILRESDTLQHAFEVFATSRAEELAVLDRENVLRGVVSLGDVLKFSLPEHLLWMEDLSPIYQFQPFVDTLKDAGDTRVADLLRDEYLTADREVPAIQLAKLFLVHNARQILITAGEGNLAGVVELRDFCGKLFWE